MTTVPSWINEKKPNVSVNKSLWSATTLCVLIYLVIGIPCAIVYADILQGPLHVAILGKLQSWTVLDMKLQL